MWNVLRHQIRNYVDNLRKNKDGTAAPQLTLRRVPVQITLQNGLAAPSSVLWGYAFLNDFNPLGVYIFSPEPFQKDQTLSITLEEPRRFFAKVKVLSSQNTKTDSKVISTPKPTHRLALEFIAQTEEEKAAFLQFAEEIKEQYLFKKSA